MNIFDIIFPALLDTFNDTWSSIPILLLLYFILEWYGHTRGFNFFHTIKKNSITGPIIGAFLGLIPQCGIGVLMTGLYLRGIISTGTILAIYISTSDEALLVILSDIKNAVYILPIILIKFITASIFGILIDKVFKIPSPTLKEKYQGETQVTPIKIEPHHSAGKHDWHPVKYKKLLWHAIKHTTNIYIYIFVISVLLYSLFSFIDIDSIPSALSHYKFLEIIIATFIGLIPNCVASVAIAQAFLHSSLSFGAVIAGLSASAGIGLIVLFKEAKLKTSLRLVFILVLFSILVGIVINSFYSFRLPPSESKYIEHIHKH
jgi:hypothetical protein